MPTDYTTITPVTQFDGTSCWAAALEWWARAAGRTVIDQLTLISKYEQYWDSSGDPDTNPNYGTVSKDGLLSILSDSCWRMRCEEIRGVTFSQRYANGKLPCIVGYFEGEVGGHHVVVACGVTDTAAKCMDPACGGFRDFRYGHFQRKGMLIVGWPR
jgi:hypothetical protein